MPGRRPLSQTLNADADITIATKARLWLTIDIALILLG